MDIGSSTSQTVTLAVMESDRKERGIRVGYDIFEIIGHTVYRGEIVLKLKRKGWRRRLKDTRVEDAAT